MKRIFLKKLLALVLVVLSANVFAGDCSPCNGFSRIFSAIGGCRPTFECDRVTLQAHAGIAPIIWRDRGNFQIVSCNIANSGCPGQNLGPINCLFGMPKFKDLYKMPWTVGGKIGYMINDCSELYIEGNYRQAKAKNCFQITPSINTGGQISETIFGFSNLDKYSFFDVYLGMRRYFELDLCFCNPFSWFVGMQVGLAHHKKVSGDINFSSVTNECGAPLNVGCVPLFNKHTAVAAGANLGFDYCIGCGWSLVLTAEFIATCGPDGNKNFVIVEPNVVPDISPSNFVVGGIATEMIFPVTLGLKYNF
jgi:hypothetical protein